MTSIADGPVTDAERTVRKETIVEADLERVWHAISDPEGLEGWLADQVSFDQVPGADASFSVEGEERRGHIDELDPERSFTFTWEREPGIPSRVRIELEPCVSGIRVIVVESREGVGVALGRLRTMFSLVAV